jgi:hypothetical protein
VKKKRKDIEKKGKNLKKRINRGEKNTRKER